MLVQFAATLLTNLYADLCTRLVVRLNVRHGAGFGLLAAGVPGMFT